MERTPGAPRLTATQAALDLIGRLQAEHGPVLLYLSGGCCDGSVPMCYGAQEFLVGDADRRLGEVGGAGFYIRAEQDDAWNRPRWVLDAQPGRGGVFSLESGSGWRFVLQPA